MKSQTDSGRQGFPDLIVSGIAERDCLN